LTAQPGGQSAEHADSMAESTTAVTHPSIQFAKVNRESKKGEDAACTLLAGDSAPAAFAVFDGHSGKETARICSEVVCQRLLKKGPPFKQEEIVDMLWAVDEEIGTQKVRDGATAQMMLVEQAGGALKATVAWCGDSSLVVTNSADGQVLFSTASHTAGPDHQGGGAWQSEKVVLERYIALRQAVEKTAGIDTIKDITTPDMVKNAIKSLGEEPKDDEVALILRALRRGKIVADVYFEMNPTKMDEPYVRKNLYVRQRDPEHDPNQVWVVATAATRADPGYNDVQMTRSIGDWRAADMVLPHPQVHTFEIPEGSVYRVCLASDGLWDICSFDRACGILAGNKTVGGAAKELLGLAEKEYLKVRGHEMMDDDTTVLVIELNPSRVEPPTANLTDKAETPQGGCCALM